MIAATFLSLSLLAPAQTPPKPADTSFGLPARTDFHWPVYVFKSPDVQKELKVTKDQLAKIDALPPQLAKKLEAGFSLPVARFEANLKAIGAWADTAVSEVLTAEQLPRYRQVVWQVLEFNGGPVGMVSNPAFATELGLTAEQTKQGAKIYDEYMKAWMKLVRANPGGNAARPGEDKLFALANEKALKLATAEQKKKWNELLGEPFTGDIVPLPIPNQPPAKFKAPSQKT